MKNNLLLLTGATGYVGGRLLKELEKQKFNIRCLARNPEVLYSKISSTTKIFKGDVLEIKSLIPAMEGLKISLSIKPMSREFRSVGRRGSKST